MKLLLVNRKSTSQNFLQIQTKLKKLKVIFQVFKKNEFTCIFYFFLRIKIYKLIIFVFSQGKRIGVNLTRIDKN